MFKKRKNSDLLFEETVTDNASLRFEEMEMPLSKSAFYLAIIGAVVIAIIMLVRVGYLNINQGSFYKHRAVTNMSDVTVIPAERGIFFDKFNKALVKNTPSFRATLKLSDFLRKNKPTQQQEIQKLSSILQTDGSQINEWIFGADLEKQNSIVIGRNLTVEQVAQLKNVNYNDVTVENDFYRQYDEPGILSHIIGYVGIASANDIKNNPDILLNDMIGKAGLEYQYDNLLKGKNGEIIDYRNSKGESLNQKSTIDSERGNNFYLTIDSDLQDYLYKRMQQQLANLGKTAGAGIVMNPNTGEVLALVSLPSFDNNNITSADLTNPSRPLFNRIVSGVYSPASTVKPLDGIAALTEGVISPDKQIYSAGYIDVPNPYFPDKPTRFMDWKKQGWVNLYSAIARSSDVYFYEVGGGFGDQPGLGIKKLRDYWQRFGFDQKTGIDLPGEKVGFLPDVEEKEKRSGTPWTIGNTYHVSIGQGDLMITPLELIDYISSIATGGKMYKPFLVKKIVDQNGNTIKETNSQIIKDNSNLIPAINEVEKGMLETTYKDYGTGYMLKDVPMKIAAKTGSAQISGNTKENAFYVGYNITDDKSKQISVLLLIEDAKDGSLNAVPVAKDLFQWYYTNRIKK